MNTQALKKGRITEPWESCPQTPRLSAWSCGSCVDVESPLPHAGARELRIPLKVGGMIPGSKGAEAGSSGGADWWD